MYKNVKKKIERGVAFPTCISVNNTVCHFSPLVSDETVCREGKIPDLSQADTSYYWVHKIQPITKPHVLLLGFTITTQKPTEICQVSCKSQSHLARVSNDTSNLARVSNDTSSPARVSDDTGGPIMWWHVSPIRLRHVSLTHLQTPINRSPS